MKKSKWDIELIVESAIFDKYANIVTGRRHDDCYRRYAELYGPKAHLKNEIIQGFITTGEKFVDRVEAWKIAKKNNQILKSRLNLPGRLKTKSPGQRAGYSLNSEDLKHYMNEKGFAEYSKQDMIEFAKYFMTRGVAGCYAEHILQEWEKRK